MLDKLEETTKRLNMNIVAIISIIVSVVLAVLLWDRHTANRRMSEDMKRQQETNMELLKRVPKINEEGSNREPLTVEKIADALRIEGFFPEIEDNWVKFKVQGEGYFVDANRLPLLFVIKSYNVEPNDWEMDLLREAAHKMSDELVMVKATFSDDGKSMRFFVAAQDRNYESLRANITPYLRIIQDGERLMNEEYNKMVEEKRKAALAAQPVIPPVKQESKVLS